jgi:hypothetical protein
MEVVVWCIADTFLVRLIPASVRLTLLGTVLSIPVTSLLADIKVIWAACTQRIRTFSAVSRPHTVTAYTRTVFTLPVLLYSIPRTVGREVVGIHAQIGVCMVVHTNLVDEPSEGVHTDQMGVLSLINNHAC